MRTNFRATYLFWILALAVIPFRAAAQRVEDTSSCRQFVQKFYSWYVPFTQKKLHVPAFTVALQRRPTVFDPVLLRALKEDWEAEQRAKGELVGIDFDPFVGSQDPADRYELRNATLRKDICFVEVWRNSPTDNSEKSTKPDTVAKLSQHSGRWFFVDFQYPDLSTDLIKVLESLRKERQNRR